jgi:3-deoxy-D-manno-octulosonate 8-phosphate phosphatase (KDO 8-P phosphatase)
MNLLAAFKPITCFVFDVDGVLTDGGLLISEKGEWLRRMNIKDGYALQLAIKKGYRVLILSGARSEPVAHRLNQLGIQDIFQGLNDKASRLKEYMLQHGLNSQQVLFMGDDIPDYEALQLAGVPCCPSDAVTEIRSFSKYVSPFGGGQGCVRDVIEKVMKLNGHWSLDTSVKSQ